MQRHERDEDEITAFALRARPSPVWSGVRVYVLEDLAGRTIEVDVTPEADIYGVGDPLEVEGVRYRVVAARRRCLDRRP